MCRIDILPTDPYCCTVYIMCICLPVVREWRSMKALSCTLQIVLFLCICTLVTSEDQCNLTLKTDPLYIFLGEQTNLTCTLYRFRTVYNTSGSENHVLISKWNKQNLNISSYVIDNDNSTVTAHAQDVVSVNSVPERVAILWYLCTSPLCEGKSAQRFLNIENRPVKVSNGSCLVYNWQNMTCAWDLGVIYRNTRDVSVTVQYNDSISDFTNLDYDVTLHWSVYTHLSPCKHIQIKGKCLTCKMLENDDRESYRRGTYMFVVNITNSRRPEAGVLSRFYFNTDELVQPAKVENVLTQVNKTEINLLWSHSKPYVSLQFKIEYKSQWENDWKEEIYSRKINDFDPRMKPTKEMGVTLTDLTPYTMYDIRISCIPIVSGEVKGFWSETFMTTARTLEDVPSAVPVVQPSFFSCIAPECSEIQIYWQVSDVAHGPLVFFAYKPIKEEDNRCDMMRYKVEPVSPKSPHSRPVFATEDSVSARLPLNTNATVQISVVPFNEKTNEFPLMEPSMLVIPPKSQWPRAPVHLEALSDGKESKSVTLTWSYPDDFRNKPFNGDFTVVWCKKNIDGICQKELNWLGAVVNTTLQIEVSNGSTVDDYIYGIAADGYYGGVRSSSGIVWADCVHFTNRTISEKLDVISIVEEIDQGIMKIAWRRYKCKEFRGQVIQYIITYCAERNCKDTTQSLNVSKDERNYTIRGLAPAKYRLWVGAVSDAGRGPSRQIEFMIYKKQNFLGQNGNENVAAAVGIALGILVVIALTIMVPYCLWKHCRTLRKDEIELPKIVLEKNSQTTSGRESVVLSSNGSSTSTQSATNHSAETHDSGFGHMRSVMASEMPTHYQPLQIMSSARVADQYYDHECVQFEALGEETRIMETDSSESSRLLGIKNNPISGESAYKSDLSSRYRSSQHSQNCDEIQQLLTGADDSVHEADDSSVGSERYSMEDISTVLDNDCDNEGITDPVTSGGSLPDYLLSQINISNSKGQTVVCYNSDYVTCNDFSNFS